MTFLLLFLLLVYILAVAKTDAHTAILFGGSGAVGGEVLRALLTDSDSFWTRVILVGRRELPSSSLSTTSTALEVTQVVLPDLTTVDRHQPLIDLAENVDACFVAIGASSPMNQTLAQWHSTEVEIVGVIARLCETIGVRYISLLSAVDAETDPQPFESKELDTGGNALGWWGMLTNYARMKGLSEQAVASVAGIASVRIMQPSNIVTEYTRYGWFDRTLFRVLPYLDPILPMRYHSVRVRLLGMAMAGDAMGVLADSSGKGDILRLTYEDFVRIAGKKFQDEQKQEEVQRVEL